MVDDDVSVWRNCEPDMNLEAVAVTVLVAGCDHADAATATNVRQRRRFRALADELLKIVASGAKRAAVEKSCVFNIAHK